MCALLFCTEVICKACARCHLRFIHAPIQLKSINAVFTVLICVVYMLFFLLISLLFDQVSHIIYCSFSIIFPHIFVGISRFFMGIRFFYGNLSILRILHNFVAREKSFYSIFSSQFSHESSFKFNSSKGPFYSISRAFFYSFKMFHRESGT